MKTLLCLILLTSAASAQLIENTSPQPTAAELAAQSVVDTINAEIMHRIAIHQICFDSIWNNKREGATPAAVFAALGTQAALVCGVADENLQHIARCAQLIGKQRSDFLTDAQCIPPVAITINQDGTVTLGQ